MKAVTRKFLPLVAVLALLTAGCSNMNNKEQGALSGGAIGAGAGGAGRICATGGGGESGGTGSKN